MNRIAPISVVIPAYNAEPFIADAIQSVRAQTLDILEIIVVDDGSTDNTSVIAANLGTRVISQPNRGASAARNAGIQAATGTWIAFLDADDVWKPEKLENQWRLVHLCPRLGAVSCDVSIIVNQELAEPSYLTALGANYMNIKKTRVTRHGYYLDSLHDTFFNSGWVIFPSTLLVSREILHRVGLFNEHLLGVEDFELIMRICARFSLAVLELPLVQYRIHGQNLHLNSSIMHENTLRYFDLVCERPDHYPAGAVSIARRAENRRTFLYGYYKLN